MENRFDEVRNSYQLMCNSPVVRDDMNFRTMWIMQDISETLAMILDKMGEKNDDESGK